MRTILFSSFFLTQLVYENFDTNTMRPYTVRGNVRQLQMLAKKD